ncbi:helix-hairpin-helix domain-containing protein [Clostridium sp. CS001]|uniref:helix-hairpin-helix domain-containing protein n=1 Tax=Clostridium sp. CS001 TaxID=2880648 RepID=UPI001CF4652A|nr:helix-hairpin-helix domain-containing protein [Clostridium sp. CS001]MCB2288746.1 helix-hairpin-helix domain-containing protein [Clostridium sp. CS001]
MKKREKIIGSIAILCLSVVFILIGYKISTPKENISAIDYKDIFAEADKASGEKTDGKVISVQSSNSNKNNNNNNNNNNAEDSCIKVDIKGAVKNPGVYEIKIGSRVTDLIKLAGGAATDADLDATNLSLKLNDENCVVIYKKGESEKIKNLQGSITSPISLNSTSENNIVNINMASKEELKTLTGIGDAKADAIIKYREENGGFKSVEELTKVDGIGEKTLSKFMDKVDIK